jgi:hypothetical protein
MTAGVGFKFTVHFSTSFFTTSFCAEIRSSRTVSSAICQVCQISRQDCAVWISGAILSKRFTYREDEQAKQSLWGNGI